MIIHIKPNNSIQEIQANFKETFSHLKPEFFKLFHHESGEYIKTEQYLHHITFKEILNLTEDLHINIDKQMSTEAFEKMFEEKYHLHVQLMRLQKDSWLVTTNSQELSLQEQNERGIASDTDLANALLKDFDVE